MENREIEIDRFFSAYERRVNEALQGKETDVEESANAFAACFIEASPTGVICSANDEKFKSAIPEGYTFYKSIGTTSMIITSKEITRLDDMHAMVRINWRSTYTRKEEQQVIIAFEIRYFLQVREAAIKIFAYITGDEQKALRDNGLI